MGFAPGIGQWLELRASPRQIYAFSRMTLRANQRAERATTNTASGGPNSTTASNQ
jgi:hypothetical protein